MGNAPSVLRQLSTPTLFLALLLCLPGCFFGVGTVFPETTVIDDPVISQKKGRIWVETEMPRERAVMASELLDHWGEPDAIVNKNGEESWIYEFGLRWIGLGVGFGLLPVPLGIPIGHEKLSFSIDQKKQLVSVTIKAHGGYGFMCSFLWHPGCYAESEWMCKILPLCYYMDPKPFPKEFREYRKDNLIPGQI
jgi:hypothetical protein